MANINNIQINPNTIFEINRDTSHTYFYDGYEITEITPEEFNLIYNQSPQERSKILRNFRYNNRLISR